MTACIDCITFQYIHPSIESDCPPSVRPIVCLFVTKNTSEYKWMEFRVKGVLMIDLNSLMIKIWD